MLKDYMAILNLAENEGEIRSLTTNRPIASLPLGSRYRVIDFMLSNIVNCGIKNVAVYSKSNSRSLVDHIGDGKPWDLNRKIDGIFLFNHALGDFAGGDIKLLKNNMEYFYRSKSKNVILASSYMVCNMDLNAVAEAHEQSGRDITVVYTQTNEADNKFIGCYTLDVDENNNRITGVGKNAGIESNANICMEVFVMSKDKLVQMIYKCSKKLNEHNIYNIIFDELSDTEINAYKYEGFVSCVNTIAAYYETNMKMLDLDVSNQLFRLSDRPIYTKIKDEPPTQYIKGCYVENALIADGCVIKGKVKNSLLGRYVDIEDGAEIEDCIILQNIRIHKGAKLSHVIVDKNVDIEPETILKGNKVFPLVIEKKNLIK